MLRGLKIIDKLHGSVCFRPSLVKNKYTDDFIMSSCRHCEACQMARSQNIVANIERECKLHEYSIFFTLTYYNEFLPTWEINPLSDGYVNLSGRYGYSLDVPNYWYIPPYRVKVGDELRNVPNTFASVDVRDIQKFIKRLRAYLSYHFPESKSIRYAIASEYGPESFRPHYHGVLWCDSPEVANSLLSTRLDESGEPENAIYKSWKMCDFDRIRPEIISGNASKYVGGYIATSFDLPSILRTKFTRPFFVCSRFPYIGSIESDETQLFEILENERVFENVYDEKEHIFTSVPFSLSFLVRHFPICACSRQTSDFSKLRLYEKYKSGKFTKHSKWNELTPSGNLRDFAPASERPFLDDFCYRDFRFYRGVERFINRSVRVRIYDDSGFPTSNFKVVKYSPLDYIQKLSNLYVAFRRYGEKLYYSRVNYAIENYFLKDDYFLSLSKKYMFDPSQMATLAFYPSVLLRLPSFIHNENEMYDLVPEMVQFDYISAYHLYNGLTYASLRMDLFNYLVYSNPYVVACNDVSYRRYERQLIKKRHLSHFNVSF